MWILIKTCQFIRTISKRFSETKPEANPASCAAGNFIGKRCILFPKTKQNTMFFMKNQKLLTKTFLTELASAVQHTSHFQMVALFLNFPTNFKQYAKMVKTSSMLDRKRT